MDLLGGIAAKYQSLAIQLGIPLDRVKALEVQVIDVKRCLERMLDAWKSKNRPLSEVIGALRKQSISRNVLATDLEKKYKKMGLCKFMGVSCLSIRTKVAFPP